MAWQQKSVNTTGESIGVDGKLGKPFEAKTSMVSDSNATGKPASGGMSHEKLANKMSKSWGC